MFYFSLSDFQERTMNFFKVKERISRKKNVSPIIAHLPDVLAKQEKQKVCNGNVKKNNKILLSL